MEKVIAGLGNPGAKYERTRHNIGFMVLDLLADNLGLSYREKLPNCLWVRGEDCALLRPLTYMNLSGEAVGEWASAQKVLLTGAMDGEGIRPLIVCDDLALPLGSLRLRARGGSGGQNGLASVIEQLGGEEFPRLRLGVAPLETEVPPEYWADYVLAEFAPEEVEEAHEMVVLAADALQFWLNNTFEATSSRFNRRIHSAE